MTEQVVAIVPRLFPALCGVGESAVVLADTLKARAGIGTVFVVGDPAAPRPQSIEAGVVRLRSRSAAELSDGLGQVSSVILHFVGYGYARRGCPWWLVRSLSRWKRGPEQRLIVIFHELYATGRPWSSAFWTSPFQRQIARRLALLADVAIATRRRVAEELDLWLEEERKVELLPIFSTIGELAEPRPPADRKKTLVIFGSAGVRARAYAREDAIHWACTSLGIDEIVDIGPSMNRNVALPRPVRELGMLPAAQVSAIMRESLAGFLSYYPGCLSKSSVFAAYASHGLVPVCSDDAASEEDDLIVGKHYLAPNDGAHRSPERVAAAAHDWYQRHGVGRHAALIAAALK